MPDPREASGGVLFAILQNHGSQLTDVTFDYGSLSQPALTQCIEALQNVTLLTLMIAPNLVLDEQDWIGSTVLDGDLLRRMTPRFDVSSEKLLEPCLCPKMTKLVCFLGPFDRNYENWVDFVAARRTPRTSRDVAWLEKLRVEFSQIAKTIPVKKMRKELLRRGIDRTDIKFTGYPSILQPPSGASRR